MNALTSIVKLWPGAQVDAAEKAGAGQSSIPTAELRELNAASGSGLSAIGSKPADSSFAGMLGRMVEDVNAKQHIAAQAMEDLQSGRNVSLHQAMIAMEEASVSFQLMVEVRNKLLDSYQELMRMQV